MGYHVPMPDDSSRISPTAHYTGYVWHVHGLSTPALVTPRGRLYYEAFRPFNALSRALGGPTLKEMLLARHTAIDRVLTEAVDSGKITQVLEVAAGYSPRGWRFTRKYGKRLRYVEADLPPMAARKRRFLTKLPAAERPEVVAIDALAAAGELSLHAVAERFDTAHGLAIVTEGLTSYLAPADAREMWARMGALLGRFPHGMYLSDTRLAELSRNSRSAKIFQQFLARFVRGQVHLQFESEDDARGTFLARGFASLTLHRPHEMGLGFENEPGAKFVQIVDARTGLVAGR